MRLALSVLAVLFALGSCARGDTNRTCFGWRAPGRFEPIACNSTALGPEELARWVGRPAERLKEEWGPATREATDGIFRVWVYEQTETSGRVAAGVRSRPAYVRSYVFWIDADGTITRADMQGSP
jgi:hypothetical protein